MFLMLKRKTNSPDKVHTFCDRLPPAVQPNTMNYLSHSLPFAFTWSLYKIKIVRHNIGS